MVQRAEATHGLWGGLWWIPDYFRLPQDLYSVPKSIHTTYEDSTGLSSTFDSPHKIYLKNKSTEITSNYLFIYACIYVHKDMSPRQQRLQAFKLRSQAEIPHIENIILTLYKILQNILSVLFAEATLVVCNHSRGLLCQLVSLMEILYTRPFSTSLLHWKKQLCHHESNLWPWAQ